MNEIGFRVTFLDEKRSVQVLGEAAPSKATIRNRQWPNWCGPVPRRLRENREFGWRVRMKAQQRLLSTERFLLRSCSIVALVCTLVLIVPARGAAVLFVSRVLTRCRAAAQATLTYLGAAGEVPYWLHAADEDHNDCASLSAAIKEETRVQRAGGGSGVNAMVDAAPGVARCSFLSTDNGASADSLMCVLHRRRVVRCAYNWYSPPSNGDKTTDA
ncbi:hypothetical protein HPB51_009063 [Rhipicephalus microplus]|uniref:Uncharacterized protein n=1 Tax=Rhipicephalus microplus TaxID=6941 RepID=A0A9J6D9D0_RHIMP|nr:hypothetical protein HPB51_009063 [Rhipicephalus microplus]